jgi:hypothetical protein
MMATDAKTGYLNGYDVRFNRRKYGSKTFTWVQYLIDGETEWQEIQEPWPCLSPKRSEVHAAVLQELNQVH